MEERLKRLENEREEDMKTLNELICQKEEIESDLYSKVSNWRAILFYSY